MLLKGVIDCPDLPLNVSRSALQNDGFVKKISDYITKKVADKLSGMYKVDRENYEKYWDDISPFIKYGCLKDDKFREKISEFIIFKDLNDKYITLPEYVDATKKEDAEEENKENEEEVIVEDSVESAEAADGEENQEEKEEKPATVYYVTDMQQQSQYVNMFKEQGLNAVILTHNIDQPFISQLEQQEGLKVRFQRIDAAQTESLSEIFKKALDKENLEVKVEKFKNENISSMVTLSEDTRRMQDMMKMYSAGGAGMDDDMFGGGETLVLNSSNKLVQYILNNKEGEHTDMFCKQLYDLAMIANKPLKADAMTEFIARSNEIMMMLAQ